VLCLLVCRYVIKTTDEQQRKVFINVCHSTHVSHIDPFQANSMPPCPWVNAHAGPPTALPHVACT
jgi:hypothetical protein